MFIITRKLHSKLILQRLSQAGEYSKDTINEVYVRILSSLSSDEEVRRYCAYGSNTDIFLADGSQVKSTTITDIIIENIRNKRAIKFCISLLSRIRIIMSNESEGMFFERYGFVLLKESCIANKTDLCKRILTFVDDGQRDRIICSLRIEDMPVLFYAAKNLCTGLFKSLYSHLSSDNKKRALSTD